MRFSSALLSGLCLCLVAGLGGCSTVSSGFSSVTSMVGLGGDTPETSAPDTSKEGKPQEQTETPATSTEPDKKVSPAAVPSIQPSITLRRQDMLYPRAFSDDPALVDQAGVPPDVRSSVIRALSKPDLVAAERARFAKDAVVVSAPYGCASPKLLYRDAISPVTRPETNGEGATLSIDKATFIDSWTFDRCGKDVRFNFLVLIEKNGLSKLTVLPPGVSLTDLLLMRDTYPKIGDAMRGVAAKNGKSCNANSEMIVDRRPADAPGETMNRWSEIWSIAGCDGITDLKVSYDHTAANGATDIKVTPVAPGS